MVLFLENVLVQISQDLSIMDDAPPPSNSSFSITARSVKGEAGHLVQVA
jgi:hypothetical protein